MMKLYREQVLKEAPGPELVQIGGIDSGSGEGEGRGSRKRSRLLRGLNAPLLFHFGCGMMLVMM